MCWVLLRHHADYRPIVVCPVRLQGVDGPHGQVAHQQEGDDLASRLLPHLFFLVGKPGRLKRLVIESKLGLLIIENALTALTVYKFDAP